MSIAPSQKFASFQREIGVFSRSFTSPMYFSLAVRIGNRQGCSPNTADHPFIIEDAYWDLVSFAAEDYFAVSSEKLLQGCVDKF